jgi:hypothetical protein
VTDRLTLVRDRHLRDLLDRVDQAIGDVETLGSNEYVDPYVHNTLTEIAGYLSELRMRG